MHWNCNSLPAHEFERVSLLQAYTAIEKFNIIAITESALKPSIPNDKISLEGYSCFRSDLPTLDRCGGAILYYKNDLSIKNRSDICKVESTLCAEITLSTKKVFFVVSYRKPSQSSEDFASYLQKMDSLLTCINIEDPHTIVLTGDFNAKHSDWCEEDTTDSHGIAMHQLFCSHSLTQTVHQPTNITSRTKHCIDLVAVNQPNLIISSDVSPSIHPNCSHQINNVKLDFKCPIPPPFTRHVWHFGRADAINLQESIRQFNWQSELEERSASPNEQALFFSETILNIAKNFIPNNDKVFNPRDPPWVTATSKNLYKKFHRRYLRYAKRGYPTLEKPIIDNLRSEYNILVSQEKKIIFLNLALKFLTQKLDLRNTGLLSKHF